MRNFIFYILICIFLIACEKDDCNKLQTNFSSYDEALDKIKGTKFNLMEKVNTSTSSWVRGASFYSCDEKLGYFIIKTDKGNYIYKNLPLSVWNGFKNASSFGSYYDSNIKHKYHLYLTN